MKNTEEKFKRLPDFMPDQLLRMLICGTSRTGKTNTLIHMLLKPLIYYGKIYLYAKIWNKAKIGRNVK